MSTAASEQKSRRNESGYELFESGLTDGVIAPGQFLSQREIGTLTGLPERATRELTIRLEADGLLTATPGRGFRVANVDLSLIREAFQLRRILECQAIAIYCSTAADEEFALQRRAHVDVLGRMTPTPSSDLQQRSQEVDRRLHLAIIAALNNSIVGAIYRVNAIKIRLIRRTQIRADRFMDTSMREHLAIIAACEARNERKAVAALALHLDNTERRVIGQS